MSQLMDGPAAFEMIGRFSAESVPAVSRFAAFRRAVLDPDGAECAFRHAPDRIVDVVPQGLVVDRTIFGEGQPAIAGLRDEPRHRLAQVVSLVLRDAVLAPDSMAVLSETRGFFEPSVNNLAVWNNRLSSIDPNFRDAGPGAWTLAEPDAAMPYVDAVAMPVVGVGGSNYRHFLYDGLAAVVLHRRLLGAAVRAAGRVLLPWQAEILAALGLLDDYITLDRPTRFRKILTSTMLSFTVSYPNRFVRTVFDQMRFQLGGAPGGARRVMISRDEATNRRIMDHRDVIEAIAVAQGFEIVRPAELSVAAQVRMFASARWVIGESGAGLANIGFCPPGASVLELQPDRFSDGWTRAACHLLGLRWHGLFARSEPEGAEGMPGEFHFEIEPDTFRAALAVLLGPG
ncbi:glycosyltransferase 61 family protein [Acidiphilium acidophilum]|uniref:glycosyltransferase family 61 protein n=1 Tax=Acidiphilium acidophilum TaxID=76588 RepID=UPI002E8E6360|nr:glycosyltransferase 61 family protein [Acidiphilium acidophilum]